MKVNIVILAAGKTKLEGIKKEYPHCLQEVDGIPVLEKIVQNSRTISNATYNFVFLNDEVKQYHLDNIARLLVPDAQFTKVLKQTKGSACTCLLATIPMNQDSELLVISANELVKMSFNRILENFRQKKYDAGTLIFHSVHPRYSYVRLDESNLVIETSQRDPISSNATAGIFWYKRTSDFVKGAKDLIRKNAHVDGSYFVAPIFNELVLNHKRVGVLELMEGSYIPLKDE